MKRLYTLLFSVFIGMTTGLSTPTFADDTVLYLNPVPLNSLTYPNVLLMVDNSGSMNVEFATTEVNADGTKTITPMGITRMEIVKYALQSFIEEAAEHVNIGLGRFVEETKPSKPPAPSSNAPIIYPIVDIDMLLTKAEASLGDSGGRIASSVQVGQFTDDAEEIVENAGTSTEKKRMALYDKNLEISALDMPLGIKSEVTVSTTSDWLNAPFAPTPVETNGSVLDSKKTAVRFLNVGVPRNAKIHRVEIDFTSDGEVGTTPVVTVGGVTTGGEALPLDLRIEGGYTQEGTTVLVEPDQLFSTIQVNTVITQDTQAFWDEYMREMSEKIKGYWPLRGTVANNDVYTSPDLATIVQNIVTVGSWTPQKGFTFLFKGVGPTGAKRGFKSATLRVYWSGGSMTVDKSYDIVEVPAASNWIPNTNPPPGNFNTGVIQRIGPCTAIPEPETFAVRLGNSSKTGNKTNEHLVGMTFPLSVPKGAKITNVKLTFTRQDAVTSSSLEAKNKEALALQIYAEKKSTWTSTTNLKTRTDTLRSSFPTTGTATWNIAATTGTTGSLSPFNPTPFKDYYDAYLDSIKAVNPGPGPTDAQETALLAAIEKERFSYQEYKDGATYTKKETIGTTVTSTTTANQLVTALQNLVDGSTWVAGEEVALFFNRSSGTGIRRVTSPVEGYAATGNSQNAVDAILNPETLPTIEIEFEPGTTLTQKLGLRFEDVEIPQKASVKSATIELVYNGDGEFTVADTPQLTVKAQNPGTTAGDSDPITTFVGTDGELSERVATAPITNTNASITWKVNTGATTAVAGDRFLIDVTDIVQGITDKGGWCGGNSMAFVLTNNSTDSAKLLDVSAYENSVKKAAVLNFEYTFDGSSSSTCPTKVYTKRVLNNKDDGIETNNGQTVSLTGETITNPLSIGDNVSGDTHVTGIRFPYMHINQGSDVLKATLTFTAASDVNVPGTLTIKGQKTAADEFAETTSNLGGLLLRPRTTASKTWDFNTDVWEKETELKVDVTAIVEEILAQSSWTGGSAMAFFLSSADSGKRQIYSAGTHIGKGPTLRVQYKVSAEEDAITVRKRLSQLVDEMVAMNGAKSPLVDSLYESAKYYREDGTTRTGGAVTFGKDTLGVETYFLSHPLSHDSNFKYYSPIASDKNPLYKEGGTTVDTTCCATCRHNYVVLMTAGVPTANNAETKITSADLTPKTTPCPNLSYSDNDVNSFGRCGKELAYSLYNGDNSASASGMQQTITHGIGFQLQYGSTEIAGDTYCSQYGYPGKDGKPIVYTPNKEYVCFKYNTSKAKTMNVGLSAATKGGFKRFMCPPDGWKGPVAHLGPCKPQCIQQTTIPRFVGIEKENQGISEYLKDLTQEGGGRFIENNSLDVGEAIEALKSGLSIVLADMLSNSASFAAPSIAVSTVGKLFHSQDVYFALFKPGGNALWEGNVKKFNICPPTKQITIGGTTVACDVVGDVVDATGASAVADNYISPTAKSMWSESVDGSTVTQGGAGSKLPAVSQRMIVTYVGTGGTAPNTGNSINLVPVSASQGTYQIKVLGVNDSDPPYIAPLGLTGKNIVDKNRLLKWISGDRSWAFGDPLHSSPVILSYQIGTDTDPQVTERLFVGTNDGLVHSINADNDSGAETWAFLPQELLSVQADLQTNLPVGLLPPQYNSRRIYGMDGTATFIVQDANADGVIGSTDAAKMYIGMRRGGKNYYAFDVSTLDQPKLMWVLKGGSSNFEKLAYTWSRPRPARIPGYANPVLIFGGGYDAKHDTSVANLTGNTGLYTFGTSDIGNAIYIVDANTGARVWWASVQGSNANEQHAEMKYAIPSDIAFMSARGDGTIDRLYVGDLGGQLWRVNLWQEMVNDQPTVAGTVVRVAAISSTSDPAQQRSFFYPPEVARIETGTDQYEVVTIATGARPDPLNTVVEDRFYTFFDRGSTTTITELMLFDATPSEWTSTGTGESLTPDNGWYIDFPSSGEKGLGSPVILRGNVFFTSYTPQKDEKLQQDAVCTVANWCPTGCSTPEGQSKLYAISLSTQKAAFDLDGDDTVGETSDLTMELKAGITSDVVPYFDSQGIRLITNDLSTPKGGALGKLGIDGQVGSRINKSTFWLQE